MPEWLKGADCKSAGSRLRWFESISAHHFSVLIKGAFGLPFFTPMDKGFAIPSFSST